MTIEDRIRDEKLQYDIKREAAKISALTSGKIDKFEYLTGEQILPSNQRQIIEQAKFAYSPLGKAIQKQIKSIEDRGRKQDEAIKALKPEDDQELESIEGCFPKKMRNNEVKKKTDEIKKQKEKIKRKDLKYKKINICMIFNNIKQ